MKRYIRAMDSIQAYTSLDAKEVRRIVNQGCDFLGIDHPIEIRKKKDGYKLVFAKYNELTLKPIEVRYDLHTKYSDELGWSFDDSENTYPGSYDDFLKEQSILVNRDYDKLYDATGIRFIFTKKGDDLFIPE